MYRQEALERKLDEAIRRVDPTVRDQLTTDPDPRTRARRASTLALQHVKAAMRNLEPPPKQYLDLLGAAAPFEGVLRKHG